MNEQINRDRALSPAERDAETTASRTRLGRRALMLGVAAAGAGTVVSLAAGEGPAGAATGGDVILGKSNKAGNSTVVTTTSGNGLQGQTYAEDQSGVYGNDESGGGYGVYGNSANGIGVYGSGTGSTGVYGFSAAAVGVLASSDTGTALLVEGVVGFSRSGVATVAAGTSSVVVSGVYPDLTASSMVLATPQGYLAGVCVAGVVSDVSASEFTIHLNKTVKTALPVAWFVIS
jgi:hypothetical protein